jgi:predicted secreted protein
MKNSLRIVYYKRFPLEINVMKIKLNLAVSTVAMLLFTTACRKSEETPVPAELKITAEQNGQPLTLAKGQTLEITLQNPGDGNFSFDQPQYNATVIRFVDHLHQGPANNYVGNYGTDSWDFIAIKPGNTTLAITATQNAGKGATVTMLSNSVSVK